MKISLAIKAAIVAKLNQLIDEQIALLETSIADAKKARDLETKSSAGDKFETSRARVQSEIERYATQLNKAWQLKNDLQKIDISKKNRQVELGSLIITTNGNYFIGIGYGKIAIQENSYYAISLASPVGRLFYQKAVGDIIKHINNTYKILELI